MEITERLEVPCEPGELYEHVGDLDRYPSWMRLVHAAERVDDPQGRSAWTVELRARIGPLARSKRLRMVRSDAIPGQLVVFERAELDGRVHARWALRAELEPSPGGSELTMRLSYSGSLWTGGLLDRVLEDEIRRGSASLIALVTAGTTR
ncbi:MAG TPA: SRPBCC family protein [Ilumatobacteraceae bacterium]|nr:SRPBCC family protein [Ilumatobacteraceae bacterium]